jgi:hypothetical protein
MPVKDEFEREFVFDIDEYLTKNYKKMSLTDRRAICSLVLSHADIGIEDVIDEWVTNRAMILAGYVTLEELTAEEDE